jgi:hypothetical protein
MEEGMVSMLHESGMPTAFWEKHWLLSFTKQLSSQNSDNQESIEKKWGSKTEDFSRA